MNRLISNVTSALAESNSGRELRRLMRQPLVLIAWLLQVLLGSWLLRGQIDNYLALQAGGLRNLSVANDLLTPMLGVYAAIILLTAPLVATAMRAALQAPHRRLSTASHARWLNPTLIAGSFALCALPLLLLTQLGLLRLASALSLWLLMSASIGLILLGLALLSLCLWLAVHVRSLAAALALGYLAMALLATLELQTVLPTPLGLFRVFRDGALSAAGVSFFLLVLIALWRLLVATRTAVQTTMQRLITIAIVVIAVASMWLPWRWQQQQENVLSLAEQSVIKTLPADARLLIISADPERRRDYHAALSVLTSVNSALTLLAHHPDELNSSERDALPGREGVLLSVAGQSAWLKLPAGNLPKQSVFWLSRLQRRNEQFLVFLEGHGERRLFGHDTRDLTGLRQRLDALGIRALPLQLQAGLSIPENTAALVIASPSSAFLPDELRAITDFLDRGGALLWLREPDEPQGFEVLEQAVGVRRLPGTVLDLAGVRRGTPHPAITLIERYPPHAALKGITSLSALPWAAPLAFAAANGFTGQSLLSSHPDSVLVADAEQTTVSIDAARGPFDIGWALQREFGAKQQRIVIVGDGHFLADTALNNYGNAALAVALMQWLAFGDDAIAATDERAVDADLLPSIGLLWWYRWGLPVGLPLLLLFGPGWYQWRWRRQ